MLTILHVRNISHSPALSADVETRVLMIAASQSAQKLSNSVSQPTAYYTTYIC